MTLEIPNYRMVEKIGVGFQTTVYRARCLRTGNDYAVKVAKVRSPEDMRVVDLMREEQAVAALIDHPVVRRVYEFRLIRRRLRVRGALLFMEYVPGMTLSDKRFDASLEDVLHIFAQVGEGLLAMHQAGFVHADLKPGNIMITHDGDTKLIDLGQSHALGQAKQRVQGTIDYMAPEQALRETIDQRTDVFGLGATLHRVLTGKPVPTEMNQTVSAHSQRLLGKRVEEIPKPVLTELPVSVARLIEDCCRSNPNDRPSDLSVVIQRLELARTIVTKPPIDESSDAFDDEEDTRRDQRESAPLSEEEANELSELLNRELSSD